MRSSRGASRGAGRNPGTRDWGALSFASLVVSVWLLSLQRPVLEPVWKNLSAPKPHPLPPGLQSADVKSSIRISPAARTLSRSPTLCSRDPCPHSDPGPFYPGKLYPDGGPGAVSLSEKQWARCAGAARWRLSPDLGSRAAPPAAHPGAGAWLGGRCEGAFGGRAGLQSADWETDLPAQARARLCFRDAFCLWASPGVPERSAV